MPYKMLETDAGPDQTVQLEQLDVGLHCLVRQEVQVFSVNGGSSIESG